MKKNRGFTLIEILIALLIFAIMGVLAAMSLHTMIRAHQRLKKSDQALLQLQITMTLLRRDFMQVIDRKVRDGNNKLEPAFLAPGNGYIIFTRTGLFNPFYTSWQSNMQRVGYILRKNNLIRLTWDVLDQPPHAKPEEQILLFHVQSIEWQFIGNKGMTSAVWPLIVSANAQQKPPPDLPKAVLMVMHIQNEGVVQGIFPIPARGVNAKTLS